MTRRRDYLGPAHRQALKSAQLERTGNPGLAEIIDRNIATVVALRRRFEETKSTQDRVADWITSFCGSMAFVYIHAIWFGLWIAVNNGWLSGLGIRTFDPFPYGLLTMAVSLEAIFLSTFVLLSQNRMSMVADHRADLDLQINLLSEYEVTRTLGLIGAIAKKLGIEEASDPEIEQLTRPTPADEVADQFEMRQKDALNRSRPPSSDVQH